MPLLDHFQPPLSKFRPWDGCHSMWATVIAQQLNGTLLPMGYVAIPNTKRGSPIEIDVGTWRESELATLAGNGGGVATAVWAPPRPTLELAVEFGDLDTFEVHIMREEGEARLVAAIELVSPANKDRAEHRLAFAIKCAAYLQYDVAVSIVDLVTNRRANLHRELLDLLKLHEPRTFDTPLYANTYRPITTKAGSSVQMWTEPLAIEAPLPTLPVWLAADVAIPLDLEASYLAMCEGLGIDVE